MPEANDAADGVVRDLMAGLDFEDNFRRLYLRYYSAVYNFLARKGLSYDDCRDVTQEVFVAVYMGVGGLRSESAFVTWLFTIARRMWLLHLERRRRGGIAAVPAASEDSASPAELAASSDPDPLRLMLDQEKVEVVRAAIEELPERVQDCLRARLVDDLSYREIGKRLGITESTVAVHVHRGIKNLRARLKAFAGPVLAARGLLDGSK